MRHCLALSIGVGASIHECWSWLFREGLPSMTAALHYAVCRNFAGAYGTIARGSPGIRVFFPGRSVISAGSYSGAVMVLLRVWACYGDPWNLAVAPSISPVSREE